MALINGGITAKSIEEFQRCEDGLAHLNSLVQTLNNKDIAVEVRSAAIGGGVTVAPLTIKISSLRIKPDSQGGFWVDFDLEKQLVSIRAGDNLVHLIYLEPKGKK